MQQLISIKVPAGYSLSLNKLTTLCSYLFSTFCRTVHHQQSCNRQYSLWCKLYIYVRWFWAFGSWNCW